MSMLQLLFPRKCVFCQKLLPKGRKDLCDHCMEHIPEFTKSKRRIPFVARWVCLWYYKDEVGESIRRFKFRNARHYAAAYGKYLAKRIFADFSEDFDVISWVPVSTLRKLSRGYDQSNLLAVSAAKELSLEAVPLLRKIRNNPPQSGILGVAQRKANVQGVYKALDAQEIRGKRILLVDDVITTGATVSECARILLTAGAKEVCCIALASAMRD